MLFVTLPVLVWLIDGSAAGRLGGALAAAAGWWFGFGYFLAGLYWVGHAFLVDAKTFGWLLPIAASRPPGRPCSVHRVGAALARVLWVRGPIRILALAFALTVAEWLRGHVLTGFPWNTYGYALTGSLTLAQSASVLGLWGLTFVAVAACAESAVLADERADTRRRWVAPALGGRRPRRVGRLRRGLLKSPAAFVEGVRLRIMQPNLQQDQKFNYGSSRGDEPIPCAVGPVDRSRHAGVRDVTHLIWPESAFPFFLTREADALAQIADLLPAGTVLITGGVRPETQSGAPPRL